MAMPSSSRPRGPRLKLLVYIEHNGIERVVYGEADKDAANFLFNLLSWSLPISTVKRLTRQSMVGCVENLYRSVNTLPHRYICHSNARAARDALLAGSSSNRRSGFVVEHGYTVSDNLNIIPSMTTPAKGGSSFREETVTLDDDKGIQILRKSLVSQTVLTDVFLRPRNRRA